MWVKVVVAIALGLGTMVGWRRHGTGHARRQHVGGGNRQAKGICSANGRHRHQLGAGPLSIAEVGFTNPFAHRHHNPNRSGLQLSTLRNLAIAWVLTLPVSIMLSALLYWWWKPAGQRHLQRQWSPSPPARRWPPEHS
jgi:PiT family inorganic phosphate transporter